MFYIQLDNRLERYRFNTTSEARSFAVQMISRRKCRYAYLFSSEKTLVEDAAIVREDGKYLCYQYNKHRESTIYKVGKDGQLSR